MLRGIQPSTADGVVLFDTIVPGHYIGRTPHIHGRSRGFEMGLLLRTDWTAQLWRI